MSPELPSTLSGDTLAFLLTYLLHSTLLLGGTWLLLRLFPPRAAALEDVLWKVALVGGLVTSALQVGAGLRPWPGRLALPRAAPAALEQPAAPAASPGRSPAGVPRPAPAVPSRPAPRPGSLPPVPAHRSDRLALAGPIGAPALRPVGFEQGDGRSPRPREAIRPVTLFPASATRSVPSGGPGTAAARPAVARLAEGPPTRPGGSTDWAPLLVGAWALLAIVRLLRLLVARRRLAALLATGRPVTETAVLAAAARLSRAAGRRTPPRLSWAPALSGPIAVGRHAIHLPPRALAELDAPHRHAMLAHEMAHLLRRDPSWLTLCGVLEAVFFLQPLNALGRRRLQVVSEFLCDDWAVRQGGDGLVLARCLARVASWFQQDRAPLPVAGMARADGSLLSRVERLVGGSGGPARLGGARAALLGATLVGAVACGVPGVQAGEDDGEGLLARLERAWHAVLAVEAPEEPAATAGQGGSPDASAAVVARPLRPVRPRRPAPAPEQDPVAPLARDGVSAGGWLAPPAALLPAHLTGGLQPGRAAALAADSLARLAALAVPAPPSDDVTLVLRGRQLTVRGPDGERQVDLDGDRVELRDGVLVVLDEDGEARLEVSLDGGSPDTRARALDRLEVELQAVRRAFDDELEAALEGLEQELASARAEAERAADALEREAARNAAELEAQSVREAEDADRELQQALAEAEQALRQRVEDLTAASPDGGGARDEQALAREEQRREVLGAAHERLVESLEDQHEHQTDALERRLDAAAERLEREHERACAALEREQERLEERTERRAERLEAFYEEAEERWEERVDDLLDLYGERDCDHDCEMRCAFGCTHSGDELVDDVDWDADWDAEWSEDDEAWSAWDAEWDVAWDTDCDRTRECAEQKVTEECCETTCEQRGRTSCEEESCATPTEGACEEALDGEPAEEAAPEAPADDDPLT